MGRLFDWARARSYGLLGASGCGKTTLLSCIVGRRSFDSGEVLVFGGEPGTPESGIPGPRVGYMPQELALYGEFTIRETLASLHHVHHVSFVWSWFFFFLPAHPSRVDRPPRFHMSFLGLRLFSIISTAPSWLSWYPTQKNLTSPKPT